MKRSARRVGLSLLGLLAFPFLVWGAWHLHNILFENPRYAAQVFEQVLPGSTPLESKRWHGPGDNDWACTYAVVALPDDALSTPPVPTQTSTHWQLRYGGDDWTATPMPPLGDMTRDALSACAPEWDADIRRRVDHAVTKAGSFVIVDGVGETVFIYSKPQGFAARVRYGD